MLPRGCYASSIYSTLHLGIFSKELLFEGAVWKHISWCSALLEISLEKWGWSTRSRHRSADQQERLAQCLMARSRQGKKKERELSFANSFNQNKLSSFILIIHQIYFQLLLKSEAAALKAHLDCSTSTSPQPWQRTKWFQREDQARPQPHAEAAGCKASDCPGNFSVSFQYPKTQ